MTWGEFKKLMEKQGVKDDMKIEYMDFDSFDMGWVGIEAAINEENNTFSVH